MKLENQTPFQAAWLVLLDKQGAENLIVVLKVTYIIDEKGRLTLATPQDPIRPVDEFYGEPGKSSIKHEAELGPSKVATDCVLVGSAVARQPDTREMAVLFRVGPVQKRLRVFGNRLWKRGLLGYAPSAPLPFERIPLTYENAYGGKDTSAKDPKRHGQEPRNPVGCGFRSKHSELNWSEERVPNIESPDEPIRQPGQGAAPQGVGFIGRDWQPRLSHAGTYDEKWQQERLPLLPQDFDERHHNAAHPDLVASGYLRGDEPVEVVGCTPSGRLAFHLPNVEPSTEVQCGGKCYPIPLNLNTALVDIDAMKLTLLWKGVRNVHKRLPLITRIECRAEGLKK